MAFSDAKDLGMVRRGEDGLVGLHHSLPQYRAWAYWLAMEFNKLALPGKWLTVNSEWPPQTASGAAGYAAWLSGIRDESKVTLGVPRHPKPWDGHIPHADADEHKPALVLRSVNDILRDSGVLEKDWFTRKPQRKHSAAPIIALQAGQKGANVIDLNEALSTRLANTSP